MMLVNDYDRLSQIVETDMEAIPTGGPLGADMLDIALCEAWIFTRSPRRGNSRRRALPQRTVEELVALRIPSPFDEVTVAYVTYQQRVAATRLVAKNKSKTAILRMLKRPIAREVFRFLTHQTRHHGQATTLTSRVLR